MRLRLLMVLVGLLFAAGCSHSPTGPEQASLQQARGAMRTLSKAMEACYRFREPPSGLSDRELYLFCTQRNPRIREFYSDYQLRFKRDHGYALILVCSQDGSQWLMEDASCTKNLDLPPTVQTDSKPCAFTLGASQICPQLK